MGAAAEFDGLRASLEHAYDIAVFVAEERNGALVLGIVHRHFFMAGVRVRQYFGIHEVFDLCHLFGRDRVVVTEVEPKPVRANPRTLLFHMVAKNLAERSMEQVGTGVIPHN